MSVQLSLGKALSQGFGKAKRGNFQRWNRTQQSLRVFANPKVEFSKLIEPHCQMTAKIVAEYDVVLCVKDTTFLDDDSILAKKEGYGPIGKGGNGLILHSGLAIEPTNGQSIGLLSQKLWNREPKQKPPKNQTLTQKKKRQAATRKLATNRPFEQQSFLQVGYALTTVEKLVNKHTRVVHAFDREGDITEV